MKRLFVLVVSIIMPLQLGGTSRGWISLFDGKTLNGWQASENKGSWQIEDGALVAKGPRSHLFYLGDVRNHNFKNFEFKADVKTTPGSNSGIYFHTEYQESGWPAKGYECQVINSNLNVEPGKYVERKMTGSLYAIRNVWKSPVRDNEWFNYHIVVQGKTIRIYINGEMMVDYTESADMFRPEDKKRRLLSSGTFALQCHDPESVVYYKNIKVKPLPDDMPTPGSPTENPAFETKLIELSDKNFPLMDLHVHLKRNLSIEQALENARKYGFTYGIAVNCGLKMGFETDEALQKFLNTYKKRPHTYLAMQAEGREWLDMFSKETVAKFDYVFTDSMTWTNDNGKRMRLWIKQETEVGDPQDFMEQLVARIEKIMNSEPIDIYVNSTFLPDEISHMYDELWTPSRMDRVIKALVDNNVALEINDRYKIPSPAFIKRAKAKGVKFTIGTNNTGRNDLGKLEYCISMVAECGLTPDDMWIPRGNN
ncbi:MAG: family 16 glycoside hydrolase [Planctomycetota bacterium]|jgi:hypothetical protein